MARINLDAKPVESERDRLLREGRMALRVDLEKAFHARTAAWKESHNYARVAPLVDGNVRQDSEN